MEHSFAAGTISERDDAWFEELGETLARGRAALLAAQNRDDARSVCDTALSLIAATDAGAPTETAVRRLLAQNPPDADAAAQVLTALARSGNAVRARCYTTIHDALNVLLAAQNRDGGWSACDRDPKSEPSCPIVTARALEALGHFGFRVGQPPINAAVKFLLAHQEDSGEWAHRWSANALQSLGQVIAGLQQVGFDAFALPVRRAVRWLKEAQNGDGSWGDATASETAWALLALLAAGEGEGAEVRAGAEFLVGTQRADGGWADDVCLPLTALGRYLNDRARPVEAPKVFVRTDAGHRASGPKTYRHTLAEM